MIRGMNRIGITMLSRFPHGLRRVGQGALLLTGLWWLATLCGQFLLSAPRPALQVSESPDVVASGIISRHPYGLATTTSPATAADTALAAYRLVGLIAAAGSHVPGAAVLAENGKTETIVVQVGQELAPGIRLLAAEADRVTLRTGQGRISLSLPGVHPPLPITGVSAAATAAPPPTASQGKTCLTDC